jgi:hypothetical protein
LKKRGFEKETLKKNFGKERNLGKERLKVRETLGKGGLISQSKGWMYGVQG